MWHIQLQSLKFRRRYIYKKIHHLTFDLVVKATRNVGQYTLHHVTYSTTQFEGPTFNGLGGDTFTRNVRDRHTDGPTFYEIKVVRDPCQKITLLLLKSKSVRVIVPESCF